MTIWSLAFYRIAGLFSTPSPRLTVTVFPNSSHTPTLSLNSTRVAPVTSSCRGCWAVAGPVAAAATSAQDRVTSATSNLLRSERNRHMSFEGDPVERDIAGHLIGADRHAGLGQHDSAGRREVRPCPPHPLRDDPPPIRRARRNSASKLHSPGLALIRGPGSMQLQLAGAAPIEPAGDISQRDRVPFSIDLHRRRL